jgi:hypothetical protein
VNVAIDDPDVAACPAIGAGTGEYLCTVPVDDGYIDAIRVSAVSTLVKEVLAFALSDGARFTEYYT